MRSNSLRIFIIALLLISPAGAGQGGSRENSSILYQEAAKIAQSGDLDRAIPVFKEVVELSPSFSLGYYGLGKACLYREGMLDDALVYLRMAVKLDKTLSKGYFYLGMGYMLKRKYGDALNAFSTAYDQDKTMLEALFNSGVIYDMIQDRHMAKQYFEDYVKLKEKKEENIIF
ncbi:MAG: hypothetical protein MUC95_07245 [Spirochaetes bacterium]|jgi:tetratricopeptide (TPR) repeat protein|nr:hypothetical protein [Spirochaetota bacterium]